MQNGNLEEDLANAVQDLYGEPTTYESEEELKNPSDYFEEYKQAAWEIARGEFPNGAERKQQLKEKHLDYATVMHYVDSVVGIDRNIDYWREHTIGKRGKMSEAEIVMVLKDLFSDYGAHVDLTRGERNQVEMWLEAKYLETQPFGKSKAKN